MPLALRAGISTTATHGTNLVRHLSPAQAHLFTFSHLARALRISFKSRLDSNLTQKLPNLFTIIAYPAPQLSGAASPALAQWDAL